MMRNVVRPLWAVACALLITSCSGGKSTLPPASPERASAVDSTIVTPEVATIPRHVLTGAYLYSNDGSTSHGRPFSAYASSLSWAETYSGTAVAASGIKTIYYTNPNRQPPGGQLYPPVESAFVHACSGERIYQPYGTTKFYLTNPMSSAMVNLYKTFVANQLARQHFDAVLDDEAFDWYALSAMPCNYNATAWLNAYENEIAAVGKPMIYNGLGNLGVNNSVSPTFAINSVTIAGMGENCYGSKFGARLRYGAFWQGMENTEISMARSNKLFMCYSSNLSAANTSIAARLYVYASFLLTYNPAFSLLWEYFATSSGYTVEPESQLVPLSPSIATPSSIANLRLASGVYARRYGACYIAARLAGPCAVVVNSDAASQHAFPYAGYHHTLLLTGGGILDGGTISTRGPDPSQFVPPVSGVIAFQ